MPSYIILNQNYPNPFNPNTKISYELRFSDNVLLKVYDILGDEIVTLVNRKQGPGKYQFDFDGSNLSSGIYFYKLESGKLSVSRKMLLLK